MFPFAWGGPALQCSGVPTVPSLRAVGARCWVGVPPPPSPPPAATCVRRAQPFGGGGLSYVSPSSGSYAALALREFPSPP